MMKQAKKLNQKHKTTTKPSRTPAHLPPKYDTTTSCTHGLCADEQLQLSPACDARPLLVASEEGIIPEIERVSEGALNVSARAKRKEYYKQASLAEPSRAEPKRHLRKEGKPISCLRSFRVTPLFLVDV